jgi:hypothetical protein
MEEWSSSEAGAVPDPADAKLAIGVHADAADVCHSQSYVVLHLCVSVIVIFGFPVFKAVILAIRKKLRMLCYRRVRIHYWPRLIKIYLKFREFIFYWYTVWNFNLILVDVCVK